MSNATAIDAAQERFDLLTTLEEAHRIASDAAGGLEAILSPYNGSSVDNDCLLSLVLVLREALSAIDEPMRALHALTMGQRAK